jgi:hypothetical protein
MSRILFIIVSAMLASLPLASCYVYDPMVVPGQPASFERSWNAALGGVQDAGVKVTSADRSTGIIRGNREGIDVTVAVVRQADGSVRVQFDSKGPPQQDPGLSDRFSQAYERRMGR